MRLRPAFLLLCGLLAAPPAVAQDAAWVAQKCALYAEAWNRALDGVGTADVNLAFLAGNENFIAGGCTDVASICPQSGAELEIANSLTVVMMNAGTASTFLPFACPRPESAAEGWEGPGL
jgi:hypothetical protein